MRRAGVVVMALGLGCGSGGEQSTGGGGSSGAGATGSGPAATTAAPDDGGTGSGGADGTSGPGPGTSGSSEGGPAGTGSSSDDGPVPRGSGSIRFFGNGGLYDDRVLITLDDPATTEPGPAVDVGDEDFTIELWIAPEPDGNPNPAISCGSSNDWVTTNIIVDRDRHSQPPSFGLGIGGGVLVWAVQGEFGDPWSMCGTTNVLDGAWHHVAVQRRRSDGYLWLYVDGQLDAEVDGPDGDISYPDDGQPMDVCPGGVCDYSDPFLAIGAEKHGYEGISYDGLVDELHISTTLRYDADFAPPTGPFVADANTVGLYHFDDGAGTVAADASGNGVDGALMVGGRPEGPQWSDEHPWR
ncbi:MAG: LamG-like jellyroll fold domain-containing protein [Myxococcota bacterium]